MGNVLSVTQLVLRRGLALLIMVFILVAGIIASDFLVRLMKWVFWWCKAGSQIDGCLKWWHNVPLTIFSSFTKSPCSVTGLLVLAIRVKINNLVIYNWTATLWQSVELNKVIRVEYLLSQRESDIFWRVSELNQEMQVFGLAKKKKRL